LPNPVDENSAGDLQPFTTQLARPRRGSRPSFQTSSKRATATS